MFSSSPESLNHQGNVTSHIGSNCHADQWPTALLLLCPQRAVCHREAVQREEHGLRVRGQVHQEAAEPGQQAGRAKGGGGEGGGHPAADPAPQHRDAARRVREPHRHRPRPGTVSHGVGARCERQ